MADKAPPAAPKPKPARPASERGTEYVVFQVKGRQLEPVNVDGGEVIPAFPAGVPTIKARTPEEARDIAFEFLTKLIDTDKQDGFTADLVALAARGWSFEPMAWKIKREVARK
jgi:hypothetical protein